MTNKPSGWSRERAEELRTAMSDAELEALKVRGRDDPASLSLDEVGVLFLASREQIRAIETAADRKRKGQ